MITLCKTKNFGINCRCGKRSVWKVPEELAMAVQTKTQCELIIKSFRKSENANSTGRTLLKVGTLMFECECGRFFELSDKGLINVNDRASCSNLMTQPGASTLLN